MRLYAMEKLGGSLEQAAREAPGGRLDCRTVCHVAEQGLRALEYIHSNGYVHCDIKPANLLFGASTRQNDVYVIDFGIAKKYVGERFIRGGENVFYHVKKPNTMEGTLEYKSCFVHERAALSRRDDLDSFGYVLLRLAAGQLPWQEGELATTGRPTVPFNLQLPMSLPIASSLL